MTREEAEKILSEFVDAYNRQDNMATAFPFYVGLQEPKGKSWQNSGLFFLTMGGYDRHMRMNAHNYRKKPRPFVHHGFRNPELENLLEAVAAIVGKEMRKP